MAWEFECPVCGSDHMVLPRGPKSSPVLIMGDEPGKDEINQGKPFVGATGGVLKTELARLRVDMAKIRITNLWLHDSNGKAECFEHGAKKAIEEGMNRKVILLIGSETVKFFAGVSVGEYNGLIVPTTYFTNAICVASIQPAQAFHRGLGEVRFALSSFASVLKKEGLV